MAIHKEGLHEFELLPRVPERFRSSKCFPSEMVA